MRQARRKIQRLRQRQGAMLGHRRRARMMRADRLTDQRWQFEMRAQRAAELRMVEAVDLNFASAPISDVIKLDDGRHFRPRRRVGCAVDGQRHILK